MRYILAVLLPPVAMLLCGRVFQAVMCLLLMLTLIGWPIAAVWALLVVADYHADRRTDRLLREMKRPE